MAVDGPGETGRIGGVVIDPRNPDVVLACALGHGYGPQSERGVFDTTDGGLSWEHVLAVEQNTGCSDLANTATLPGGDNHDMWIDPTNGDRLAVRTPRPCSHPPTDYTPSCSNSRPT